MVKLLEPGSALADLVKAYLNSGMTVSLLPVQVSPETILIFRLYFFSSGKEMGK